MEVFRKQGYTWLDVIKVVPVWISGFLPGNVWEYGVSDMACSSRSGVFAGSDKTVLDNQDSLGLGVFGQCNTGLGGTVQLWFLQSDADVHTDWPDCDDFV